MAVLPSASPHERVLNKEKNEMTRKFFLTSVAASLACNEGNRDDNDRHGLAPALRRCLVRFGRRRDVAYGKICKLG